MIKFKGAVNLFADDTKGLSRREIPLEATA